MVKPKEKEGIKLEDYFYVDIKGVLRWRVKCGQVSANALAGKKYGKNFLVCFRGHYYPVDFITNLLITAGVNKPLVKVTYKKDADTAPGELASSWADPKKTYMSSTEELGGFPPTDGRHPERTLDVREAVNDNRDLF